MRFPEWIGLVVAYRRGLRESTGSEPRAHVAILGRGLEESLQHGTAALGEIATPSGLQAERASGIATTDNPTHIAK